MSEHIFENRLSYHSNPQKSNENASTPSSFSDLRNSNTPMQYVNNNITTTVINTQYIKNTDDETHLHQAN